MKKYKVYAMAIASKFIGEFEAESKEEAEEKAWEEGNLVITLCHYCSREVELSDIYDYQVDEAV